MGTGCKDAAETVPAGAVNVRRILGVGRFEVVLAYGRCWWRLRSGVLETRPAVLCQTCVGGTVKRKLERWTHVFG